MTNGAPSRAEGGDAYGRGGPSARRVAGVAFQWGAEAFTPPGAAIVVTTLGTPMRNVVFAGTTGIAPRRVGTYSERGKSASVPPDARAYHAASGAPADMSPKRERSPCTRYTRS